MPFIRKIEARAYARATEVTDRVADAILNVFPEETRQNVIITGERVEGQSGDEIVIFTGFLDSTEDCELTFDYILNNLKKSDRGTLRRTLDLRLSEKCVSFLRIDKQGAFLEKIRLADNADVIRARIYFKDSPRCKPEDAIHFIEQRLLDTEA